VDHEDQAELQTAEKVNAEIVDYALERGGTCTGEHGIGSGKKEHLEKEHGDSLPFMRKIKGLADPNGIMNPGKIFSDEGRQLPEGTPQGKPSGIG
jgi:D-lactate dehydrogenase (cytochrome)